MSKVWREGGRLRAATELRDAALVVLTKRGTRPEPHEERIVFEPHSPENPTPYLSLSLSKHPLDGHDVLNVWATRKGKHLKVLNIHSFRDGVGVVSFRRGEWESELLAMGRATAVVVH